MQQARVFESDDFLPLETTKYACSFTLPLHVSECPRFGMSVFYQQRLPRVYNVNVIHSNPHHAEWFLPPSTV